MGKLFKVHNPGHRVHSSWPTRAHNTHPRLKMSRPARKCSKNRDDLPLTGRVYAVGQPTRFKLCTELKWRSGELKVRTRTDVCSAKGYRQSNPFAQDRFSWQPSALVTSTSWARQLHIPRPRTRGASGTDDGQGNQPHGSTWFMFGVEPNSRAIICRRVTP